MKKYVVRPGDTMWAISKATGIRLNLLMAANPQIQDPNRLQTGSIIAVPELHKSKTKVKKPQTTKLGPGTTNTQTGDYVGYVWSHKVIPNETWSSIASRYGLTVEQLRLMNPEDSEAPIPGEVVYVPNLSSQTGGGRVQGAAPVGVQGPGVGPYGPGAGPYGPGMGQYGPSMGQYGPGAGPYGPGMGQYGPGMGQYGPGMGQYGPGMGQYGPGMGPSGPGMGQYGPGMGQYGPGMGQYGPGMGQYGHGMGAQGPGYGSYGPGGPGAPMPYYGPATSQLSGEFVDYPTAPTGGIGSGVPGSGVTDAEFTTPPTAPILPGGQGPSFPGSEAGPHTHFPYRPSSQIENESTKQLPHPYGDLGPYRSSQPAQGNDSLNSEWRSTESWLESSTWDALVDNPWNPEKPSVQFGSVDAETDGQKTECDKSEPDDREQQSKP